MYPIFVFALLVACSWAQFATEFRPTTTSDGCWKRISNCRLSCVRPIDRIDQRERECLEQCMATPNCQGIVYNQYASRDRCEMYDRVPIDDEDSNEGPNNRRRPPGPPRPQPRPRGGGGWRGRPSHGRGGRWRFSRDVSQDDSPQAAGVSVDDPQNVGAAVPPPDQDPQAGDMGQPVDDDRMSHPRGRGGYAYYRGHGRRGHKGGKSGSSGEGSGNRKRPTNRCIEGSRGSTVYKWTGRCQRRPFSSTFRPPTTTESTTTTSTTRPVPSTYTCPAGESVRYISIKDFQNTGPASGTFTTSRLEDCLQACERNQLPNRQQALCRSVSFNQGARECRLHEGVINHQSGQNGASTPGSTYYEKVCVRDSVTTGCTDLVETLPQQILIGHATDVLTRASYAECVRACYASASINQGTKCVSAQYYFEFDSENCVLNNVGKDDFSDLMVEETEFRVNYFEISCRNTNSFATGDAPREMPNLMEVGRTEWGPWSPCDGKSNRKIRFRNCKRNIPRACESEKHSC